MVPHLSFKELTLYGFYSRSKQQKCFRNALHRPRAVSASDFEFEPRVKRLKAIKHTRASQKASLASFQSTVLLVAAHAGQKAGLVEPPVEEATRQQELEASVAEFEESLSKDSRVSVKKDDGEA